MSIVLHHGSHIPLSPKRTVSKNFLYFYFFTVVMYSLYSGILSGDIIHLKILNQHVVVVSSMDCITDLFEKRGSIYSDRYQSVMLGELCVCLRTGLVNLTS